MNPEPESLSDKRRRAGKIGGRLSKPTITPALQQAARANGKLGGRPQNPLEEIPCNCRGEHAEGRQRCPRGRAERRREKNEARSC